MNWTWFWEVKSTFGGLRADPLKLKLVPTAMLGIQNTGTTAAGQSSCTLHKLKQLLLVLVLSTVVCCFTHGISGGTFHLCVKVENCVYRNVKDRVPCKIRDPLQHCRLANDPHIVKTHVVLGWSLDHLTYRDGEGMVSTCARAIAPPLFLWYYRSLAKIRLERKAASCQDYPTVEMPALPTVARQNKPACLGLFCCQFAVPFSGIKCLSNRLINPLCFSFPFPSLRISSTEPPPKVARRQHTVGWKG